MSARATPASHAALLESERLGALPHGEEEMFVGYGVLGLPFASGDLLAFRRFTATTIGPPFTSIWHRDPRGRWRFYLDVEPSRGCPRYFGAAIDEVVVTDISLTWTGSHELNLSAPAARLHWAMRLTASPATRTLSALGAALPERAWSRRSALVAIGSAAGGALGAGRLALQGLVPNGQRYRLAPRQVWLVGASAAVVGGRDLGRTGTHERQSRLGDLWLPNRGLFALGHGAFEPLDAARHDPRTGGRLLRV